MLPCRRELPLAPSLAHTIYLDPEILHEKSVAAGHPLGQMRGMYTRTRAQFCTYIYARFISLSSARDMNHAPENSNVEVGIHDVAQMATGAVYGEFLNSGLA